MRGGGGSLGLFTALRSRPSARMTPPPGGGGGCLCCAFTAGVCPPPGVLWLLLRLPHSVCVCVCVEGGGGGAIL